MRLPFASNTSPVTLDGWSSVFSVVPAPSNRCTCRPTAQASRRVFAVGVAGDVLDPFHAEVGDVGHAASAPMRRKRAVVAAGR